MRRQSVQAMLFSILLAGCGSDRVATENGTDAENLQALENRLKASMDPMTEMISRMAIRNAGHECEEIASTSERSRHQGALVWTARCSNGSEWTVMANDDGSHRVMTQAEAQELGIRVSPARAGGE